MKIKIMIIIIIILEVMSSCSDRDTEETINSTVKSNKDNIKEKNKNSTESHESKFNTKAQQEQELVDPEKIIRPR
ncbi:hypothetical protein CMV00_01975 [Elizabethkingia anophelis]|nr:hypothetical protein [Elizabethkingia anophelis]